MQRSTVDFSNMIHFTGRAYNGKPFDQQFIPYETIWQKYQRESMNADVLAMSPTRRHNVLDFIQTLGDNEVREGFICWFRKLHSAADRIGPCRHCGGRIILCILECPLCQCDYPFLSGKSVLDNQNPKVTHCLRTIWVTTRTGVRFRVPWNVPLIPMQIEQKRR